MSRSWSKHQLKVKYVLLRKQIPVESSLYVFSLLPVCCSKQNRRLPGQFFFQSDTDNTGEYYDFQLFSIQLQSPSCKKKVFLLFSSTKVIFAIIMSLFGGICKISATQEILSVVKVFKCQFISNYFDIFVQQMQKVCENVKVTLRA